MITTSISLLKIDGQGIEGVGLFSLVTDLTRYLIKKELCLYTTQITKNNNTDSTWRRHVNHPQARLRRPKRPSQSQPESLSHLRRRRRLHLQRKMLRRRLHLVVASFQLRLANRYVHFSYDVYFGIFVSYFVILTPTSHLHEYFIP